MRFLCFSILFLILNVSIVAQTKSILPSLQFKSLTINDGLPDNTVKCIFDDHDGFIWYGTKNGLARYDGTHFSVFKNRPNDSLSLPDDFVYCLSQLYDGRIVVGGANGSLSFLSPDFTFDRNIFTSLTKMNVKSAITDIVQSNDSLLWIASQADGLFMCNLNDSSIVSFPLYVSSDDLPVLHLSDLCLIGDGLFVASDASSIVKIDLKSLNVSSILFTEEKVTVQSFGTKFFPLKDTALWFTTERNGVFYFSLISGKSAKYRSPMLNSMSNILTDLAIVNDSILLVSTDGGGLSAQLLFSETYQRIVPNENVRNSLSSSAIWDVHVPKSGDLYIGTYAHGACFSLLSRPVVSHFGKNTIEGRLLTSNSVLSIVNCDSDYCMFSTDGGGLYRFDLQNQSISPISPDLQNPLVTKTIYPFNNGFLCGTYGKGLVSLNNIDNVKVINSLIDTLRDKSVWSISSDNNGNIWCGTLYHGIYRTSGDSVLHYSVDNHISDLPANMVNVLTVDKLGHIWIGTEGSGPRFFCDSVFKAPENWGESKNVVYSICILPDSCVAVSYKNFGVDIFKYKDGKYWGTDLSLLSDLSVKSLLYDVKWGLFCITDQDVYLFDNSLKLNNVWSGIHGIVSEGFNSSSISLNGDYLLIGSVSGLNVISLALDKSGIKRNSVCVSDIGFYRDQRHYSISPDSWVFSQNDTIALSYNDVDVRLTVAKLGSHIVTSRVVFRIPGLIDEWTSISDDYVVILPFIKGGEFDLELAIEVQSVLHKVTSLHLSVKRPYWEERWFVTSCIFFLIFLFFSVYMYRDFSHRKLESLLQQKVDERTLYIMQQNRRLEDNSKLLVAKNQLLHEQKIVLEEQKSLLDDSHLKINERNDILEIQQEELERVNLELVLQQKEIEKQAGILSEKNKLLTKSLNYAKRIQDSLFPAESFLKTHLPQSFVFFHPKEIVSGDFFWMKEVDGKIVVAEVDCTGHGVPGAFMSMIGNAFLNEIVVNRRILDPAEIFYCLNEELMRIFGLGDFDAEAQDDGMDLSLLVIDVSSQTIRMSSAMQNVYVIYPDNVIVYQGDIFSIGGLMARFKSPIYTVHSLPIVPGMKIIMASDGYVDQFGGIHKEKYGTDRFLQLMNRVRSSNCSEILEELESDFSSWLQDRSQLDDVIVVGFEF